jgi:EcsC protein family
MFQEFLHVRLRFVGVDDGIWIGIASVHAEKSGVGANIQHRSHRVPGLVVTQKLAAQTIPLVGALGGAAVNYAFIQHFQEVARGHFTVRRLERAYGKEAVRKAYERFAQDS